MTLAQLLMAVTSILIPPSVAEAPNLPEPEPQPVVAPPPTTPSVETGHGHLTPADVPPILHRIAECESGGDWTADNPRSTASGKWQWINSTWRSLDASEGYSRAKHAPPHVQRAAAVELFEAAGTRPWNASRRCWS